MAPKKSEPPKKKQKGMETMCNTSTNNRGANPKSLAGNLSLKEKREKVAESVNHIRFNKKRCRMLTESKEVPDSVRGVLYWMSRDQRVQDNWAFLFAQRLALKYKVPLHVCFCLAPTFLGATIRHYMFMIKGLKEVEKECRQLDINFHLLTGEAGIEVPQIVRKLEIGTLVTDFAPLRVSLGWVEKVKNALPNSVPFCQVDAHNVVPCWHASDKQEVGARTIRKKIHNQLDEFLTEYPPLIKHPHPVDLIKPIDWDEAVKSLTVNMEVAEVDWAVPGTASGLEVLTEFCEKRLKFYADKRNDPNSKAISNLSPWLHYGQISAQRCILTVKEYSSKYKEGVDSFVEEALVRRELSENFCFYNSNYDNINGASAWAKKTLEDHKKDKRGMLFNKQQLEDALTHDDLWNAAQLQMVKEGKLHGFMRMYWAKKILEWTKTPEEALEIAIYLNDKYSLDGRDPNGYVGCMWSICGIHDQGWAEREVFGKIRFMNYAGCKRKFDISAYVTRYGAKAYKYPGKQY